MNLHHQHQYSADREAEKMNEIEDVSKRLKGIQEVLSNNLDLVSELINEVAELKKADEVEVKPVFPRVNYFMVNPGTDEAADLGLTSNTESGICEIKDQLHARAHIIEEINKVNGHRGKFVYGTANMYFYFGNGGELEYTNNVSNKLFHDDFYIDHDKESGAVELLNDKRFIEAFHNMLNKE